MALTVVMILLSVIGRLSASSLRVGQNIERHVTDLENVRRIISVLPARDELANRSLSGEAAGYQWQFEAKPFTAKFLLPPAQTPWAPEMVVVTVEGPGGAPLNFDMVRLVKVAKR